MQNVVPDETDVNTFFDIGREHGCYYIKPFGEEYVLAVPHGPSAFSLRERGYVIMSYRQPGGEMQTGPFYVSDIVRWTAEAEKKRLEMEIEKRAGHTKAEVNAALTGSFVHCVEETGPESSDSPFGNSSTSA